MINIIKKIIKNPMIFFTYCKLYYLYRKTRFQQGFFQIFNKKFIFVDSASFVSMYQDIFINESYKFKTDKTNPLIIDCGANIGLSVLYFKNLYPNSVIKAFEPDKKIFKVLESNCQNFNFKNVTLINKGVWTKEEEINFLSDGADGGRIVLNNSEEYSNKVEMIRLRDLLEKKEEIDLLKIDIEGAEIDVLNDCRENLSNIKLLFVEYHSFLNRKQELDEILKILKNAGFRYYINGVILLKSPFLKQTENNGSDLQLNIYAYRK